MRVALLSPQPAGHTQRLAGRFDVPFEFLINRDSRAAKALGIDHPGDLLLGMQALGYEEDTVLPTVIVTDEDGTILLAAETDNDRVRPEPATFLRVLDARPDTRAA